MALTAGGAATMPGPPAFDEPVTSVDEIAARLAPYVDHGDAGLAPPLKPVLGGAVYGCDKAGHPPDGARPATPRGTVPAYEARLAMPGLSEPVNVRFWLLEPAEAERLVDVAQRAARRCARRGRISGLGYAGHNQEFADSQRRAGWRWSQAVEIGRDGSDTDPSYMWRPFVKQRVVAVRGALLAEITWDDHGFTGMPHMPWARAQGEEVVASILAAVGGDPSRPAPTRAGARARTARLMSALPDRSAYGGGVRAGRVTMMCGEVFRIGGGREPTGAATSVTRTSAGSAGVTETLSVYGDVRAAERRLRWVRDVMRWEEDNRGDAERTCRNHRPAEDGGSVTAGDPKPEVSDPYRARRFRRGPWAGYVATVAARLKDLPEHSDHRDSVAHVRVVARNGTTVADLIWEAPSGDDLDGTLRRGLTALTTTLEALPP